MNPVLIGAGIGALGSAVQGKSPLTGALLGGATGGLFGGSESLLGGKIASAFGQGAVGGVSNGITAATGELAKQAIPSVGIQGLGQNIGQNIASGAVGSLDDIAGSWAIGQGALPATTTTGAYAGGIPLSSGNLSGGLSNSMPLSAMNTSKLFNYTDPTMMEKVQGFGNDAYSWAKDNPMSAGGYALKGAEALTEQPRIDTSAQRPVRQGSFQGATPATAVSNVAPQIIPVPINKTGMMQVDTVVAQHPELRKLYPDLFGG